MPHSFKPRPGMNLKQACRERDCTLQDLVNNALEEYLGSKRSGEKPVQPAPSNVTRTDYCKIPDNYDGSPHVITMEQNGDAYVTVKQSDGTTRRWTKPKGSHDWIPVARLIVRV